MKVENRLPSKLLLAYCYKIDYKIAAIGYDSGFITPNGHAYDILMAPGWSVDYYGDHLHTFIAATAQEAIETLRTAMPCECDKEED